MRGEIRTQLFGLNDHLRIFRCLVRIGDAGELLDLALACKLVETFTIPSLALFQAGCDVNLKEATERTNKQRARRKARAKKRGTAKESSS